MFRVWLIDDEIWVLKSLERLIPWEEAGMETVSFTSARKALATLDTAPPDAIVSDIRMPGMTGLELLAHVREAGLGMEVVLVSAFADFAYAQEAVRQGAFEYLLKPVKAQDLRACAERLAKKLRQRGALEREKADAERLRRLMESPSVTAYLTSLGKPAGEGQEAVIWCPGLSDAPSIPGFVAASADRKGALLVGRAPSPAALAEALRDTLPAPFGLAASPASHTSLAALVLRARMAADSARFFGLRGCLSGDPQALPDMKWLSAVAYRRNASVLQALDTLEKQAGEGRLLLDALLQVLRSLAEAYEASRGEKLEGFDGLSRYEDIPRRFDGPRALFPALRRAFPSGEDLWLETVMEEVHSRFMAPRTLSDLALSLNTSQGTLSAQIKARTGLTYSELIQNRRMEKAREYLAYSDESVVEIAEKCGYADAFYFSKLFKRVMGMSPRAYRLSRRQGGGEDSSR